MSSKIETLGIACDMTVETYKEQSTSNLLATDNIPEALMVA